MLPRARNCTTRGAGSGRLRPASTPHVICTRRPCCPTGWCWSQGDLALAALPRARNCTTHQTGPGRPRAASTPRVMSTRRPCCQTGWCWLQGDLIVTAIFPRAQNCTALRRPRQHQHQHRLRPQPLRPAPVQHLHPHLLRHQRQQLHQRLARRLDLLQRQGRVRFHDLARNIGHWTNQCTQSIGHLGCERRRDTYPDFIFLSGATSYNVNAARSYEPGNSSRAAQLLSGRIFTQT
jgi:hypothetical protein